MASLWKGPVPNLPALAMPQERMKEEMLANALPAMLTTIALIAGALVATTPQPAYADDEPQSACIELEDPGDPESDCIHSHGWGGDDVPLEDLCKTEEGEDAPPGAGFDPFELIVDEPLCEPEQGQLAGHLPPIPQPPQPFLTRNCSTGDARLDANFAVLYQFWLKYIKVPGNPTFENPDQVQIYAEVCIPPRGLLGQDATAKIVDLSGAAVVNGTVDGWSLGAGPKRVPITDERYPFAATVNARQLDFTARPLRAERLSWLVRNNYPRVSARFVEGAATLAAGAPLGRVEYTVGRPPNTRRARSAFRAQTDQKYPLLK